MTEEEAIKQLEELKAIYENSAPLMDVKSKRTFYPTIEALEMAIAALKWQSEPLKYE